ncbi:MAG: hypothetical protein KAI66_13210 [Lentisphaeria bacterium]|nr:hypothetical protein [Lentisphaeria bacterium]
MFAGFEWTIATRALRGGVCLSIFAVALCGVPRGNAQTVSQKRLAVLATLVQEHYAKEGLESSDIRVRSHVIEQFYKLTPDFPKGVPSITPVTSEMCRAGASKVAEKLVNQRHALLDQDKLEEEAKEKYPIYEKGSFVTVYSLPNPVRPTKVRGIYQDRNATTLQIGRHKVLLRDMAAVDPNNTNDFVDSKAELLKFNPVASRGLRKQYVQKKNDANDAIRSAYKTKVEEHLYQAECQLATAKNEAAGYMLVEGQWKALRDVVSTVISQARRHIASKRDAAAKERMASLVSTAERMMSADRDFRSSAPGIMQEDPVVILADRARAAELAAKAAQETATISGADPTANTNVVTDPAGDTPSGQTGQATPPVVSEKRTLFPIWMVAVIAFVVLGLIGSFIYMKKKRADGQDHAKFFKGKGQMQKDFWAAADADPENFKYVAYRYPEADRARQALLQLSYMMEVAGDARTRNNVLFGNYEHQGKFVTFVGGTELHYALWREASAVFPEFPGAEYFRVSTAPEVKLELPDLDALQNDQNLKIEQVEVREGTGTDFSTYYVYRAPNRRNAIEFLKHANVSESGVHVLVETPEGTWGKDENGIYQE